MLSEQIDTQDCDILKMMTEIKLNIALKVNLSKHFPFRDIESVINEFFNIVKYILGYQPYYVSCYTPV